MTKLFIAMIIGCGLLVPSQSLAKTSNIDMVKKASVTTAKPAAEQPIKKDKKSLHKKTAKKVQKTIVKKAEKKPIKKPVRKVVSLDFGEPEKRNVSFNDAQVIKSKAQKAKAVIAMSENRGPASVAKTEKTVAVKAAPKKIAKKLKKPAKKVQIVKAKLPAKRDVASATKPAPKDLPKEITVAQLKKNTKPYWSAYCRGDGIVLNSHVYCAMKNPQKQGAKAVKRSKLAVNKDLEAKKRK